MLRFICIFTMIAFSFARQCHHQGAGKESQGIEGWIYEYKGNQMPSPDVKPNPPKGIQTVVYIYELTNLNQVNRENSEPFFSSLRSAFVAKVVSDSAGHFILPLHPGRYSVFTKKGALFYANEFDAENNIQPVEVAAGKWTKKEIRITWGASF